MSKKIFSPESFHSVDNEMSIEKLTSIFNNSSPITGKVLRINSQNESLEVDLGNGFYGTMKFVDTTIYPIYKGDETLSPSVYTLVGNNIQAKIISLNEDKILLSRKENMLEALEYLKSEKEIEFASITGFSKLSAFIDIGAGIIGRSYGKNFSVVKYDDIKDTDFRIGDTISVKTVEFLEESNRFELSRVDTLPSIFNCLHRGDIVIGKVFNPVSDPENPGYYVAIDDNNFCGIVDVLDDSTELKYGDSIWASIHKITNKGVKLRLVNKI